MWEIILTFCAIYCIISYCVKEWKKGWRRGKAIKNTANKLYPGTYLDEHGCLRHLDDDEPCTVKIDPKTGDKVVASCNMTIYYNISEAERKRKAATKYIKQQN